MVAISTKDHFTCENYLFDDCPCFKHFILKNDAEFTLESKGNYVFLFLLKGTIKLLCSCTKEWIIEEEWMCSLNYGMDYTIACSSEAEIIVWRFIKPQIEYEKLSLSELKEYTNSDIKCLNRLPITLQIRKFLDGCIYYLNNGIYCTDLQNLKQVEWIFLMKHLYSKEENAFFFTPLIREKDDFVLIVKKKAATASSVRQLADNCNMTTKTLTRKFKKYFNTTPKQWLLNRKINH